MNPKEEIWPPEIGDESISIMLIDSMWDWSLGILECVYSWDFLVRSGKLPYS